MHLVHVVTYHNRPPAYFLTMFMANVGRDVFAKVFEEGK